MNYGTAEVEIAERINSYIDSKDLSEHYEATVFPQTEAEYKIFYNNFTKARVAIEFIESLPEPGSGIGFINQEETVRFRLIYEAPKLRGLGGIYNLQELTKWALIGWRLTEARTKLTISKYGLLEFEQNKIQPYFEFECKAVNVQAFPENFEDDMPLSENNGIEVEIIS